MKNQRRLVPQPRILHYDDHLLVVDKPSGVFLTPQPETHNGIPDLLAEDPALRGDEPFLIAHRIHEMASGAVVFARTTEARRALAQQFDAGEAGAVYLALVVGFVIAEADEIVVPLYFDKSTGRVRASDKRGDPAVTAYRIVERVAGNTLLECRPKQERFDQVRAHLAAIGHPLTIDPAYGGGLTVILSQYKARYRPSARHEERPLIERLTLHCARVEILHPATGQPASYEAPLPKDMRATVTQLGRLQ